MGHLRASCVPFYFRCLRQSWMLQPFSPCPFRWLPLFPVGLIVPSAGAGQHLPEGPQWQQALSPPIPTPLVAEAAVLAEMGSWLWVLKLHCRDASRAYLFCWPQRLKDNCWKLERVRGGWGNLDSSWSSVLSHCLMGLSSLRGGCVLFPGRVRWQVVGSLL